MSSIVLRKRTEQLVQHIAHSRRYARGYATLAVITLALTTAYWSTLGALTQLRNADALVDPYLFKDWTTFQNAVFPGQHTQLLKWPVFLLVRAFNFSSLSYVGATMLLCLVTVTALMVILYRIDRRPLMFGTFCLALTSVLLLIPAQPYPGGLLPVNMAMISTRNIEYIVFIASLVLLAKTEAFRSWHFVSAVALLSLLIVSDKLFLSVGLAAAILLLGLSWLAKRRSLARTALYWLLAQVAATIAALAALAAIDASHITHISGQGGAGPYSFVTSMHQLLLGSIYALLGILTNLGANPAFNTTLLKDMPRSAVSHLASPNGMAFVVNGLLALVAAGVAVRLVANILRQQKPATVHSKAATVSMMLLAASLVSIVVFIASDHYYPVDARYMAIMLPAVVITAATYFRTKRVKPQWLLVAGIACGLAIVSGMVIAAAAAHDEQSALDEVDTRNMKIVAVTQLHPTDVLVGDYWRVLPIAQYTGGKLHVLSLTTCTAPRDDLSSITWRLDLATHSFSYLLTYDQKLTNYPSCTLDQVIAAYGRPDSSVLIAGSHDHPLEQLLIYDHGSNKSHTALTKTPATVVPIPVSQLPNITCDGPTLMAVVAHEDDDILFMNPDILHAIRAGNCVRTVYLTAGDGGFGQYYWLRRQQGAEAAYAAMIGRKLAWTERIVRFDAGSFATVATPVGNSQVSLIFFHLPDGNLLGQGFGNSHRESLDRLLQAKIPVIHSVDGQSQFTENQLVSAIESLLALYNPAQIDAQSTQAGSRYPDHSDHRAAGRLAQLAYEMLLNRQPDASLIALQYYVGYPVHARPADVSGQDLLDKTRTFLTYAQYDDGVCRTDEECIHRTTYGFYLSRQYTTNE